MDSDDAAVRAVRSTGRSNSSRKQRSRRDLSGPLHRVSHYSVALSVLSSIWVLWVVAARAAPIDFFYLGTGAFGPERPYGRLTQR